VAAAKASVLVNRKTIDENYAKDADRVVAPSSTHRKRLKALCGSLRRNGNQVLRNRVGSVVGYKKCPHNWAHRKAEQHDFDRRSKDQQKVRAQEPQRRNTTSHKRREQHDKNGKARTDREKVDKQRPAGLRELPKEQPAVLKKALAYCREEFRACEVRGRARPVVLKVAGMTPDKLVAELVRVRKVRAELRQAPVPTQAESSTRKRPEAPGRVTRSSGAAPNWCIPHLPRHA
jgi:hypothetical protein